MIRINLLKAASAPPGKTSVSTDGGEYSQNDALVRILVIMLFPALLYTYEITVLPGKRAELRRLQNHLVELQTFNQSAQNSVVEIKKFKEDKAKLEAQISAIQNLSKDRMRDVKVLDAMQTVIPERAWLTHLELRNGSLILQGLAVNDSDVSAFIDGLSKSIYFSSVNLQSAVEQVSNAGNMKKFEIICQLEGAI